MLLNVGDRDDNAWHQYTSTSVLDTKEKYDKAIVVEKTHWGYYTWPKYVSPRAVLNRTSLTMFSRYMVTCDFRVFSSSGECAYSYSIMTN